MKLLNLVTLLSISLLVSCVLVDDQRIATVAMKSVVNPKPLNATKENNDKHKILIGVIDSGVDYNHPALQKNIHYVFENGVAVRTGYDFIGMDNWPAPYLAATASEAKDGDVAALQTAEAQLKLGVEKVLEKYPQYSKFINNMRQHKDEAGAGIDHGTHVSGLSSYDNEAIGLLPYRILPHQWNWDKSRVEHSAIDLILMAIEKAIEDGATVINMSIGKGFDRGGEDFDANLGEFTRLQNLILKHSGVLFVAAAGNSGKWLDANSKYNYPCGVQAQNIICVGSLNSKEEISSFSNMPLSDTPLVFALGEKVLSTTPTSFCPAIKSDLLTLIGKGEDVEGNIKKLSEKVEQECVKKDVSYREMSGTSMASPLIAHVLAEMWLKNPTLTGPEVLNKFMSVTKAAKVGRLPISKFSVKLPSWYKNTSLLETVSDKKVVNKLEFVVF